MVIALLTAAGSGLRMGRDIPKQFIHVEEKPIIVYTMEAFQNHPMIDKILVVTLPAWIDVLKAYAQEYGISKLSWIVPGGETGQESIHKGLLKLKEEGLSDDTVVVVHDGNRSNVSSQIISNSLAVYNRYGSAVAAIPCVEAVFRSEDEGFSSTVSIPREQLYRTQTPHSYSLGKLLWAHEMAENNGIVNSSATCTLMQELGETIYFSKGSVENIKITTEDDLVVFKALLKTKRERNG